MRIATLLVLALLPLAAPASGPAQTLTVPPFESVALRDGGEVIIGYGPARRVTVRQGSPRYNRFRVVDGRLTIDHCPDGCPRGERLVVEILVPRLASVSVSDGGLLQVQAGFPAQETIAAAVASGGAIDIRALSAASVAASVAQGGIIFTRPRERLVASVIEGGRITYWGTPAVQSSVRHGLVSRGDAADAERPFAELHPNPPRLPAIQPIPPLPSIGN
jgi:hypothetical protein